MKDIEERNKRVELDKKMGNLLDKKNLYYDFNLYSSNYLFLYSKKL